MCQASLNHRRGKEEICLFQLAKLVSSSLPSLNKPLLPSLPPDKCSVWNIFSHDPTSLSTVVGSLQRWTTYPSWANQCASLPWPLQLIKGWSRGPKQANQTYSLGFFQNFMGKEGSFPPVREPWAQVWAWKLQRARKEAEGKMRQWAKHSETQEGERVLLAFRILCQVFLNHPFPLSFWFSRYLSHYLHVLLMLFPIVFLPCETKGCSPVQGFGIAELCTSSGKPPGPSEADRRQIRSFIKIMREEAWHGGSRL